MTAFAGEEDTLEFYHGYYHDESEWPAAKVMRDIYDEFAKTHADGEVKFEPIAVENRDEIVSAEVAGGNFPDMVDCGLPLSLAAISQGLVLDLKPYIDENNLQDAVGLNYTQNDVDGHIYTVHDQLESRGLWYNTEVFEQAGITAEEAFKDWESFGAAWIRFMSWAEISMDMPQDRAPVISLMQFLHLQKREERFWKAN